jgi:response regulator RpfG family c-di-GMP phosphodiesterase
MDAKVADPPVVLFVDDEVSILSALRRLFRPQGYRVLLAESAKAGLAMLETEPVDLVVSDMRMPEMDGAALLEQVHQRWPTVGRILLTGYADIGSTVAAINRGQIHRYIAKPWDDRELVMCVQDAWNAAGWRRKTARCSC